MNATFGRLNIYKVVVVSIQEKLIAEGHMRQHHPRHYFNWLEQICNESGWAYKAEEVDFHTAITALYHIRILDENTQELTRFSVLLPIVNDWHI